jgi:hypothetical protein
MRKYIENENDKNDKSNKNVKLHVYSAETALQVAKETLETAVAILNAREGFGVYPKFSNPSVKNNNRLYYHVGSIEQVNGYRCYATMTIERLPKAPDCVYPLVGFYSPNLSENVIPAPIQNPTPVQIVEALIGMLTKIIKE